jgi:hypothetical protein
LHMGTPDPSSGSICLFNVVERRVPIERSL